MSNNFSCFFQHISLFKVVSELRFFFGPGYRIYYCKQGQRVVILLAGGDKSTQSKDIKLALQLAQDLEEEL
ncbi:hypothetical protein EA732_13775 [Acinetobacter baumannii]|nr:hypothetical protein EA732_13775 [Acinetobacter baumannii]